jgi:hypothetical protein
LQAARSYEDEISSLLCILLEIDNFLLDKAKKKSIFALHIGNCYTNKTLIKSLKGGLPLMKKIFAIFVAMLLVASLSISIVGCKKAEEPAPTPAVEAPAPAPAPAPDAAAPAPAPAPAPAAAPAPAPAK